MSQLLARSAYEGQVATRCFPPTGMVAAASATWAYSRSFHFARDRIVNPKVYVPNFYVTTGNVETDIGPGTVSVYIEYPSGTLTLADQGADAAMPNGVTAYSFGNLVIPDGAMFMVRMLMKNANGIPYINRNVLGSFDGALDGLAYGTGAAPDPTGAAPAAAFQRRQGLFPVAITSQTRKKSFAMVGTSKLFGIADKKTDNSGDLGPLGRAVGQSHAYINLGIGSSTLAALIAQSRTYRNVLIGLCSHIINEHGVNDIQGGSDSAATLAGRRADFAALYPNHTVIGCTIPPVTGTTGLTSVSISGISRSGTTATATVTDSSGLTVGQIVNIQGVTGAGNDHFNGPQVITGKPSGTTFTYTLVSGEGTAAGTLSYDNRYGSDAVQVIGTNGNTVLAFNDLVRAGIAGEAAVIDLADCADPQRSGKWPASRNPYAATGTPAFAVRDGLHEQPGYCEVMRDRIAPLFDRLAS